MHKIACPNTLLLFYYDLSNLYNNEHIVVGEKKRFNSNEFLQ